MAAVPSRSGFCRRWLAVVMAVMAVAAPTVWAQQCKWGSGTGSDADSICDLEVDIKRLSQQFHDLGHITATEYPAVTRVLFSPHDVQGREFVKFRMQEEGLKVTEDAAGNIFGTWDETGEGLPMVLTGSHTDAIPYSGQYDGVVGVLGAIEALAALKRAGFKPKRPLSVVMFTSEEPTRFGVSCSGSRLMSNQEGFAERLVKLVDDEGKTFTEAAKDAGYKRATLKNLKNVHKELKPVDYFVELHIEQGPILEETSVPIGVVTAIAAPAALRITFAGFGGHAGAVLMPRRNDAGLAGAEVALAVEKAVLDTGAIDTVGTSGKFEVRPGAVNSIPRDVVLEIDIRDIDGERRDKVVSQVIDAVKEVAGRRKVNYTLEIINQDPPATCGEDVVNAAIKAADHLKLPYSKMVSRAYHDSLFMAQVAPTGMIFIPCKGGFSHRPDEFASDDDLVNGVKVLALTMAHLSTL